MMTRMQCLLSSAVSRGSGPASTHRVTEITMRAAAIAKVAAAVMVACCAQTTDTTTNSFSRLVVLGTQNFDEQVFNKIVLATAARDAAVASAIPATDFLNSIGVVSTFPDRGQPLPKTVEMVKYAGFRWVRGGIEGLSTQGPTTMQTYLDLHEQTGVRFNWGLVSGGSDLAKLIETARQLAAADALLAFEGNNEPNNWGVSYQGEKGGGRASAWLAGAKVARVFDAAVKRGPLLNK